MKKPKVCHFEKKVHLKNSQKKSQNSVVCRDLTVGPMQVMSKPMSSRRVSGATEREAEKGIHK